MVQINNETAKILEYKVRNNANIFNLVGLWKPRLVGSIFIFRLLDLAESALWRLGRNLSFLFTRVTCPLFLTGGHLFCTAILFSQINWIPHDEGCWKQKDLSPCVVDDLIFCWYLLLTAFCLCAKTQYFPWFLCFQVSDYAFMVFYINYLQLLLTWLQILIWRIY